MKLIWHMYHNRLITLTYIHAPIKNRWETIKKSKDPSEHALRFHLLKSAKGPLPKGIVTLLEQGYLTRAYQAIAKSRTVQRLHRKECVKDCPWNGSTIFP